MAKKKEKAPKKEKGYKSIMTFSTGDKNFVRGRIYEEIPKGHEGYFNEA